MTAYIVKIADKRGEFVTENDGFTYWWPQGQGFLSAHHLRELADELDRRNAAWEAQLNEYFAKQEPKP